LETASEANAQALGLMLWAENVRSVVYRYNLSGSEEERNYLRDLNAYRFRQYPLRLKKQEFLDIETSYDSAELAVALCQLVSN
jgi:hypothetical protein